MSARPVVWIGTDAGASKVYFSGKSELYPIPEPVYEDLYSEHQMMSGVDEPGLTVTQHFGTDTGIIQGKCNWLDLDMLTDLKALRVYEEGGLKQVQFGIDSLTWLCEWRSFRPARRTKRKESYTLEFELRIVEVVE